MTGETYRVPTESELEMLKPYINEANIDPTKYVPEEEPWRLQQDIAEEIHSDYWGMYYAPYNYRFFRLINE